eukprot:1144977-Pelagomonas_calceolata.AAC.8
MACWSGKVRLTYMLVVTPITRSTAQQDYEERPKLWLQARHKKRRLDMYLSYTRVVALTTYSATQHIQVKVDPVHKFKCYKRQNPNSWQDDDAIQLPPAFNPL